MNQAAKSSFGRLVKYLTDDQQKEERVGEIRITNCQSEVPEWASLEVETTQKLNRRATSDRTYHLLISFPEGERPSQDVLQDIEDRMCEALVTVNTNGSVWLTRIPTISTSMWRSTRFTPSG